MLQMIKKNYEHTIFASYIGYITQAIVNNLAPLLFLTFASTFNLSLAQITMITTINFITQLIVDLICAKVIDRIGYRIKGKCPLQLLIWEVGYCVAKGFVCRRPLLWLGCSNTLE